MADFPIVLDKPSWLRLDYQAFLLARNQFGLDITSGTLTASVRACTVLIWAGCYHDTPRLSYRRVRDQLQNTPSRLSGILAAENDQAVIFELLTREIAQPMEGLAGGPGA
jgi:hypothetical protein